MAYISDDKSIGNYKSFFIYVTHYILVNQQYMSLVTDIVAHTIASKLLKIQRQRAVLMQANVAQMFNGRPRQDNNSAIFKYLTVYFQRFIKTH